LAAAGAHVVLNGRDSAKLEKLASELPTNSYSLAAFDLENGDDIPAWINGMAEKNGPFAGLVHTAGLQISKPLRMIDAAFIERMFNANVTSGIMLAKGLRLKVCHTDGASLVLVGSMAARKFGASNAVYAASKGSIAAATKALAHELLRDKIRVNCVVPALIESDMAEKARQTTPKESWDAFIAEHLLGIGATDDVANAILYLLSDQTKWMTGTELQVDGGLGVT
jgi:NAD(P)-dependent dehydrogenase (short-subunit alcohol dehydrogenase family)